MAHVIQHISGSRFYTIVFDPTLLWSSLDIFPGGMEVVAIEMAPFDVGDSVIVRDGIGGPRVFSHEAIDSYDIAVRYYGKHAKYGFKGVNCKPHVSAGEAVGRFALTFEIA